MRFTLLRPAQRADTQHFYLDFTYDRRNYNGTPHNDAVHTECRTIKNSVCSAAEAECAGLFHNAHTALGIRQVLEAVGHSQHPTGLKTDNKTTKSFFHALMRIKRSKSWDIHYHWLRKNATRKLLHIFWDKGSNNNADYHAKHHSPAVHKIQHPCYILKGFKVSNLAQTLCGNTNFLARACSTTT